MQHKTEIITELSAEAEAQPEAVITIYPHFVICFTPNGVGLQIMAKDADLGWFVLERQAIRVLQKL
jgi:hypothetical protein